MNPVEPISGVSMKRPARMPGDFTLQEPQGLGNDYQGLLTGVLDGDMPADPVTVVVRERSGPTLAQTMLALKHQTYPKALLNVVVARATSGDLSRNNTINQADSEWIVLLDSGVVPVAELIELFVRHLQRTNSVLCGNLKPHHDSWSKFSDCLLYTSPSPRDRTRSRMPSSA